MSTLRMTHLMGTLAAAIVAAACSGDSVVGPSTLPGATGGLLPQTATGGAGAAASPLLASSLGRPVYADVSNQGGMGVYASNGASLVRQPDGLQARLSMPTPEPGTYDYPPGIEPGHPEVFTLWIFVFDEPSLCVVPHDCGPVDIVGANPVGGAYNGGGHAVSGRHITIAGRIARGEMPLAGVPFDSPGTAAVHLAIAPHGGLDPSTLPEEFRLPAGNPNFWWIALFD